MSENKTKTSESVDIIETYAFPHIFFKTALDWQIHVYNTLTMKNLNYILSVILIALWVIGFFTHFGGYSIHFLLVGAFTLILINVINDDKNNSPDRI